MMRYFILFELYLQNLCIFYNFRISQFKLPTVQMLSRHVWLLPTMLDGLAFEHAFLSLLDLMLSLPSNLY